MKRFLIILLALVLAYALGAMAFSPNARAEAARLAPEPTPAPELVVITGNGEESPEPMPEATPAPTPEPTPEPTPSHEPYTFYVKVNVAANTVTVYAPDEDGAYTEPYLAMICSTGPSTPTEGVYEPGWRLKWQTLFGGVYGQFAVEIDEDILFHSVPYSEYGNKGSLEYWEFDQLGESVSMGCVRLQVKDAKWIYDHVSQIQGIEFYEDEDPGPLGRPEAPKIGDDLRCRSWDPTDPDPENPWLASLSS